MAYTKNKLANPISVLKTWILCLCILIFLGINPSYAVDPIFDFHFGSFGTGNGQFNRPSGIAQDSTGNIYVVDTNNNRIQKFDSTGNFVLSFGTFGTGENQLNYPQQIAMSGLRGFVADTGNNRIYSFYFPEPPVADY